MKIIAKSGDEDLAMVYIAEMKNGMLIEFSESIQPPIPREKKWVLTLSTLYGCPVKCRFCDAGGYFRGKISTYEIISQIDFLTERRFRDKNIPIEKFKIQFSRMGEPSFNKCVLDTLEILPRIYKAPGLIPSVCSMAPKGTEKFFDRLFDIKEKFYKGRFQLQFSIHTTDLKIRDWLIPVKKWDFEKIAEYGETFYREGERKISLDFALAKGMPIDPNVLLHHFSPDIFCMKITPLNPTYWARKNRISPQVLLENEKNENVEALRDVGYDVIVSIGESRENQIGSNCGQHIINYLRQKGSVDGGYTYPIQRI